MTALIDAQALAREIDDLDYAGFGVRPEYLDYNGHLNIGYYTILFDQALGLPWERLGISSRLDQTRVRSSFTLETHITYLRELRLGDPVTFSLQVIDHDSKRIHYYLQMLHAQQRWVAATCEQISSCMDMSTRRTTNWPEPARQRIAALAQVHAVRPRPEGLGRAIGIRRKGNLAI